MCIYKISRSPSNERKLTYCWNLSPLCSQENSRKLLLLIWTFYSKKELNLMGKSRECKNITMTNVFSFHKRGSLLRQNIQTNLEMKLSLNSCSWLTFNQIILDACIRTAECCHDRYSFTSARFCRSAGYQWSGVWNFSARYIRIATLQKQKVEFILQYNVT